ncbi:uncharacterized protein LOC110456832 [Mizuhopecten yessoensis]|uniref:Ig-like domain-containing protein n=1 Tax=Mizuhopecten yessoensis TaxID=6573 RepID=A0A210QA52_MIZYE|nr:uncharacterized protein LOC110456832 [Mizuhopecten yessoensis]OWF45579.1 hypothetical protein KP79_PYT01549 [Mizuhopecten yessoensis]
MCEAGRSWVSGMAWSVWYILVLQAWFTAPALSNCDFPSYLPPGVVWTATYRNKGYLTLYFKQNMIDAMYCPGPDQTCVKYERSCIQEVEAGKYLVKHQPKGRDSFNSHAEFMCMQFIKRSDYIVQFKTSAKLNYQNPDFCSEENLNLDHWPILSPSMMKSPPITCPIVGGYNMRIHGPEGDICPGKLVLPRMESECEDGDGIRFDFRYNECLHPNLKMRIQQSVKCVTSWDYGKYTFVILRPDTDEFEAWCLRITRESVGEVKQIHLFMDPVCDPGTGNGRGQITKTDNYLSITLQKITIPSVCANEFEGCNDRRFCDNEVVEFCHLSCNRCEPETEPCTFQENIRGSWLLDTRDGPQYMNISSYKLFVPKFGRFHCLARNVSENESRTALLHVFDNGCFPRFACLEMYQPATSVRQFRLSNRVNWPHWPIDEAERFTCKDNKFKTLIEMGESTRKVNIPTQVLLETKVHYSTNCKLPDHLGLKANSLFFREGDKCNGCLIYDPATRPDKIDIVKINCEEAANHIQYLCLATLDLGPNTRGVVTGTKPDREGRMTKFYCWVFTLDGTKRKIIVLKAADCNMLSVEKVLEGLLTPEGKFDVVDSVPGACPPLGNEGQYNSVNMIPIEEIPLTIHERSTSRPNSINTKPPITNVQSQHTDNKSASSRGSYASSIVMALIIQSLLTRKNLA